MRKRVIVIGTVFFAVLVILAGIMILLPGIGGPDHNGTKPATLDGNTDTSVQKDGAAQDTLPESTGENVSASGEHEGPTLNDVNSQAAFYQAWINNGRENTFYNYCYSHATSEQKEKLDALPSTNRKQYYRPVMIIMGDLPADTPRVTYAQATKILEEVKYLPRRSRIRTAMSYMNAICGECDYGAGSGMGYYIYYLNDAETEWLELSEYNIVYYSNKDKGIEDERIDPWYEGPLEKEDIYIYTVEDYTKFLATEENLPEDFVTAQMLSGYGKMTMFHCNSKDIFTSYSYSLSNMHNSSMIINIRHNADWEAEKQQALASGLDILNILNVDGDINALKTKQSGVLIRNDVIYTYRSGMLLGIKWKIKDIVFDITAFSAAPLLNRMPDDTHLKRMLSLSDTELSAVLDELTAIITEKGQGDGLREP